MKINTNLYPNGKKYALTMSYDDGRDYDRRVVEIFDKNGIKGTFHLNSSRFDSPGAVTTPEIPDLYKNHEVSCHTLTHPFLQHCPVNVALDEIRKDRELLEKACGYTVRGMSYPFGTYNEQVIDIMRMSGMNYSRTTIATNNFNLPSEFLAWHPTTHHKGDLKGLYERLIASRHSTMQLLYIWGHSYEFENDNNWNVLEDFCKLASGNDDIWYATNIEIFDYVMAIKALQFGVNYDMVYNPSCCSVWVAIDGVPVEIKPGENKLV